MSRTTESLPQAAAPVRAAVRLAIIVSLSPVSGLGCWPGAAAAEGGGHVGLLAFLLACAVLRAALLLAARSRESAVVGQAAPNGEA